MPVEQGFKSSLGLPDNSDVKLMMANEAAMLYFMVLATEGGRGWK